MFESIIQYFIERGELHERAVRDIRSFASYLENQTEYTKSKLKEVIQRFNYDTIKPDENDCYPQLEFWRGVDDFGSTLGLDYDGGVFNVDDIGDIVKGQYGNQSPTDAEQINSRKARTAVKIDTQKFPLSLLGYYEYKFSTTALYYTWMAHLWQEVEGYRCGLKVMTIQNNSIARFSLNDFLDDDFSAFMESDCGEKPPKIEAFFSKKLSIIELFLRASQIGYPFNPYQNYWRYFEKGNQFQEIVTYEFVTGIRSGNLSEHRTAQVVQTKKHGNPKAALMTLTNFTNQAIHDGWEEKLRPLGLPRKMHDQAYDFSFWTGLAWFSGDEQKNRKRKEDIEAFESKHGIKFPDELAQYLRLFNGRQYNKHKIYFPIDDLYTVGIQKFFTLTELDESAAEMLSKNPKFLWIGLLKDYSYVGVCIQTDDKDYGKIVISKDNNARICDYSFGKFAQYAQGTPVQPEIFAAQENDTDFLKKRLEEGWDSATIYHYQNALSEAAEHNAHEALELLLQHGARLKHKNHRTMTWSYDEKTMDLLDKYP